MNILVTGGYGFIGSNFILHMQKKYPDYHIINLDLLTYAADLENLKGADETRHTFIKGDICDFELVRGILKRYDIKHIIHFAAESHVDNSIKEPFKFIKTNIEGTFSLLHAAFDYWMEKPFRFKKGYEDSIFYHISTDEVFGSIKKGKFTENSPYAPNSPYSASKASSDMLVRSYQKTYGLNTLLTNCSNNYGPRQHEEKLIPTIIKKAVKNEPIPIYGTGENIRDWLYVKDHCEAIDLVFHKAKPNSRYNIGGECELKNIEIADKICSVLDDLVPSNRSYKELITFVEDRYGHDQRYAIDISKIKKELGWTPKHFFEDSLKETVKWYLNRFGVEIG